MMHAFKRLLRDQRGTSIIELALVAPILATMVVGMVDLSRGYSQKLQLEQAAQRSIEKAMNGDKETALYETLKAEGAEAGGVAESAVEVKYWLECNGVSQNTSAATMATDYEKVCPDGQTYARYVKVKITKTYTPMFQARWLGANSDGSYTLVGDAGIRVQ